MKANLADVLRLHILLKYVLCQVCTGHTLNQLAGLVVFGYPFVLSDLSNSSPAQASHTQVCKQISQSLQ